MIDLDTRKLLNDVKVPCIFFEVKRFHVLSYEYTFHVDIILLIIMIILSFSTQLQFKRTNSEREKKNQIFKIKCFAAIELKLCRSPQSNLNRPLQLSAPALGTGNSPPQMKLPASNIQSAAPRYLELLTPVNLHFRCGIPLRERNDSWSRVHLAIQKSSRQVSVSANSPYEMSYNDFESHGSGKKGSSIHFIGVGGSGLSALAMLALKQVIHISYHG